MGLIPRRCRACKGPVTAKIISSGPDFLHTLPIFLCTTCDRRPDEDSFSLHEELKNRNTAPPSPPDVVE